MVIETIEDQKSIRDKRTPDFFHTLTEADIENITIKLASEPTGRFKSYLNNNVIREVIISISDFNPDMVKKFHRYMKKKDKKLI
jgi:hypothetical protein